MKNRFFTESICQNSEFMPFLFAGNRSRKKVFRIEIIFQQGILKKEIIEIRFAGKRVSLVEAIFEFREDAVG